MEQAGLGARDLVPYIGSRPKVSEVLSGKRPLTMRMARGGSTSTLGFPPRCCFNRRTSPMRDSEKGDWSRFPVREMVKAVGCQRRRESRSARKYLTELIRRAGCATQPAALYRRRSRAQQCEERPWALEACAGRSSPWPTRTGRGRRMCEGP